MEIVANKSSKLFLGGGNTCFLFAGIAALESSFMVKRWREAKGVNSPKTITFSEKDAYNCIAAADINLHPMDGGRVMQIYQLFMEGGKSKSTGLLFTEDAPEPYDFIVHNSTYEPQVSF